MEHNHIPIYYKYALSISEAALYFGIGEKKIRAMVSEYPTEKFYLYNGVKVLIKRELFAGFLNELSAI